VFGIAVGAFGMLLALAVVIGTRLDRDARSTAWDRIATARRINHELKRQLDERELALDVRTAKLDHRERRLDRREQLLAERELGGQPRTPPDLLA
jgi:hypothetical protein